MIADICIFLFICYFIPSLIAMWRGHRNIMSLSLINLFFGWTFVGWVVCLAWSFTYQPPPLRQ